MANKKIALITGGSRGLGKEMALELAKAGNDIVITYNSSPNLAKEVVEQIKAIGGRAVAIHINLELPQSIAAFINELQNTLQEQFGNNRIDFLVNNAGMGATIPFEKATETDFDRFMNVHLKSVFYLTQQLLPHINDGGSIIQISSSTTSSYVYGYSIYASMKGAVEVLTRYLAKDLGPRGIRVNVVAPGPTETDFNNAAIRNNPERKQAMANMAALGRVGQADDIAGVIKFLCSSDSKWITGQRIAVSGGINL
jgi:NAD(P)-dependent dehydrogenase (short-subunit alcohol dehydrogenase family)